MFALFDAFTIIVAVITAVGVLAVGLLSPGALLAAAFGGETTPLAMLCVWTLVALPLAYAMPRLRARFFGRMWRTPSCSYVMPRWVVHLLIGAGCGQVAALGILAVVQNHRHFYLAASLALIFATLGAGAWRRLNERPNAEWPMRW